MAGPLHVHRTYEEAHGEPLPLEKEGVHIFPKMSGVGVIPCSLRMCADLGLTFHCPKEGCEEVHSDLVLARTVSLH